MSDAEASALFEQLERRYRGDPAVIPPAAGKGGKFGASGLKVDGKIFAMLTRGDLVVKLPQPRVDELVAASTGRRFDPRHGRLMKEWIVISISHGHLWSGLAEEARQYVAAIGAGVPRR